MKNLKSNIPFIFCIMFMFVLSVFALGFNFNVTTLANSVNQTSGTNTIYTTSDAGSNSATETSNISGTSNLSGTSNANGNEKEVSLTDTPTQIDEVGGGSQDSKTTLKVVWSSKKYFNYTGYDQKSAITASCVSESDEPVSVQLKLSFAGRNNSLPNRTFRSAFLNCGTYTFTASFAQEGDADIYTLSNPTETYYMQRVEPTVESFLDTEFTYKVDENGDAVAQYITDCVRITNDLTLNPDYDSDVSLNIANDLGLDYFTTVPSGNGVRFYYTFEGSLNFMPLEKSEKNSFVITVNKLDPVLDVSGVRKVYTYNGAVRTINSGATVNNNEQKDKITYSNNTFKTVAEGNGLEVKVSVDETDNYNEASVTFTIRVDKCSINTSNFKWYYPNAFTYEEAKSRMVFITGYSESEVTVSYKDNEATNAGNYTATATFTLVDSENYVLTGGNTSVLAWKINKQRISRPVVGLHRTTSTYNGEEQNLSTVLGIKDSLLYIVDGNLQKNAGVYNVVITLKDAINYEWDNGSGNDITIIWTIEKLKLATPEFNLDNYDGTEESINISSDSPYYIIYGDEKFILLGLVDRTNYAWESTDRDYLRIDIHRTSILDGPALPIFVISLTIITLILVSIYFAAHSTIILKRHRKKIALIKKRKLKRQLVLASSENLAVGTNFTTVYEEPKEEPKKQEADIKEVVAEVVAQEVVKQVASEVVTKAVVAQVAKEVAKEIAEEVAEGVTKEVVEEVVKEVVEEKIAESGEESALVEKPQKPRGRKPKAKKVEDGPKTRKTYTKSRKIESKKKVAQKKRESNAKKAALRKEAEKKKIAKKKANAKTASKKAATKKATAPKATSGKTAGSKATANKSGASKTTANKTSAKKTADKKESE